MTRSILGSGSDGAAQAAQHVSTRVFLGAVHRAIRAYNGREAGPRSGVAGRPGLTDPVQQRIAIAVQPHFDDMLDVLRRLPLLPQGAAGSAEVMGQTGGESALESVSVGVGEHQNVA